jgi:hypothetical protein
MANSSKTASIDRARFPSFPPASKRSGFYQDADHNRWHAR